MDWLRCNSEALTVFEGAERAKGDLDPLFVVPADVGIEYLHELFEARGAPLPRIEQLRPSGRPPVQVALATDIQGNRNRWKAVFVIPRAHSTVSVRYGFFTAFIERRCRNKQMSSPRRAIPMKQ